MRAGASDGRHWPSAGHVDVVPPGDRGALVGRPVRRPRSATASCIGRGAADMKSGVAAFVAAAAAHLAARRAARLDRPPDHRRRGGRGGQRHGRAPGMGGASGRALRRLPRRRADLARGPRRHGQDRPARLAHRPARGARPAGPHRLPAARRQRRPPAGRACCSALTAEPLDGGTEWFEPLEPAGHLDRHRQPGGQRHPGRGHGALQHPLQRPPRTAPGSRRWLRRRIEPLAADYVLDVRGNAEAFLTRPGPLERAARGRRRGGDRPAAGAQHVGRHLGRALRPALLPGGRVRPGRRDHAPGRRAGGRSPTSRPDPDLRDVSAAGCSPAA